MAKLTTEDVLRLAELARITLDEDEVATFREEISSVLTFVEQLQAENVDDVEPTSQVTGLTNVMRPDTVKATEYNREDLLKNTPELTKDGYIKVRRVIS